MVFIADVVDLRQLDLSGNNLVGTLPAALSDLTDLLYVA
jgi:hypothetical protein